ncbi:hypothetical protein IMZ29_06575 [Achromobacter sp. GG226]|uniref:hypothetical protein n=1 Tax=Verticiella alkaliphila TaxID=2779529 RepID=UPI001C0D0CD7|nr:hypothetical protein [Verticiella sp. GG226]MBU4610212.1 hypothetical protein [Verticiella sp. GG226]
MSRIVAARFDTFEAAEQASLALQRSQFAADAISVFFVTQPGEHGSYPVGGDRTNDPAAKHSPKGAIIGAVGLGLVGLVVGLVIRYGFSISPWILFVTTLLGAYIGSLLGALIATKHRRPARQPGRPTGRRQAGVMAAVRVDATTETQAVRTLRDAGGLDIEQAEGQWRDGQWVDFDPVHSPVLTDKLPATAH